LDGERLVVFWTEGTSSALDAERVAWAVFKPETKVIRGG
jgi:hypothetical protein